jgi:hypothetical protein
MALSSRLRYPEIPVASSTSSSLSCGDRVANSSTSPWCIIMRRLSGFSPRSLSMSTTSSLSALR